MERVCKICGEVKDIEEFEKAKTCKLGRSHRCKKCHAKQKRLYVIKNKDIIKEWKKEYFQKNKNDIMVRREKVRNSEENKEKRIMNRNKIIEKRRCYYNESKKIREQRLSKYSTELSDGYVRQVITAATGIRFKDSKKYPEFIESYRQQIKVKRLLKSIKNENKQTS